MNLRVALIFIYIISFSGCGFTLSNLENNYKIINLDTTGHAKTNYKLKNKLMLNSKEESVNSIELFVDTKINKSIKEKNISNQISKYQITLTAEVKYRNIIDDLNGSFIIKKSGNYNVSSKYSETLNSEKNIINSLVNEITNEITENLSLTFNDT